MKKLIILSSLLISGCTFYGMLQDHARKRNEYVSAHPELHSVVMMSIIEGKVCVGMTLEDVKIALNEANYGNGPFPEVVAKTSDGLIVVNLMTTGSYYSRPFATLYFRKGKVERWISYE